MTRTIKNAFSVKSVLAIAVFTLAATGFFWSVALTSEASLAFTEHPSASFGLAAGQTARLNVVNPNSRERKLVTMQFLDEAGNVLKTARIMLEPKQAFGLLLPASELGSSDSRVQIRAIVRLQGSASNRLLLTLWRGSTGW